MSTLSSQPADLPDDEFEGLSDCISRAIEEYFASSQWPVIRNLARPVIRVEAFLEDGTAKGGPQKLLTRSLTLSTPNTPVRPTTAEPRSGSVHELESVFQRETLPGQINIVARPFSHPNAAQSPTPGFVVETQETAFVDDRQPSQGCEDGENDDSDSSTARHKETGGLRLAKGQESSQDVVETQRQLQSDNRNFPKRRKIRSDDSHALQPSSLDKLIVGIWEQLHGSIHLDPSSILDQIRLPITENESQTSSELAANSAQATTSNLVHLDDVFSRMNVFCRKVTQASRACRSIELLVQAHWIEQFDSRIRMLAANRPDITLAKHKKVTMMHACQDFEWTEKELRNKMAIWRGYKEVKDAGGWVALVFAGMGLYRFCKYRIGFDKDAMQRLRNLRPRLEVAADTLHPNWRRLLQVVGESTSRTYTGHPHDWVVSLEGQEPVTLRQTYLQWDPLFHFEHLEESIIDNEAWKGDDPRWIPPSNAARASGEHHCEACGEKQSDDPKINSCYCFPTLYGCGKRNPSPVQVYRTPDGRNNGLLACCPFDRGAAIGEFTGLVTRNLRNLDVMDGATPVAQYQIWQGRQGNYTRFVNHSCKSNAQFQRFAWLDTQRVVLVSKGIEAGAEITVDYSDRYWGGLDKTCLCGEGCCRYNKRSRGSC